MSSDGLRLAVGTLSALPVPAPRRVDRRTASQAMLLAPLVGLVLGGGAALVLAGARTAGAPPLLAAVAAVAALAVLTRALHLDGLADTADGLGSGKPAEQALEIMKRSDIGPFGVVTLLLVLLADATALPALPARDLVTAVLAGRAVLPLVTRRGTPAARTGGLGATVVGTVPPWGAALVVAASAAAGALVSWSWQGAAAVLVALVAGEGVRLRCVRRLGGVTGDVLGAAVETGTLAALVVLALA
ncbi:cobalamin-5'-phosphate synthase [Motilibacter rhizosphaerae]|uniref:Adenosylcobinamide-GDP ribazoletransferase n=1 Tax=Motilibacter rhizosphaerae TaxID=598652 RepID=A0A4V2F4J9_9ACTN|nr:adenosylcobinamide-GDP ribazoletransferase [Motilibacter rhizosphaerae]RZS89579.1 cobalamin-5'-phosphate synthase [Motilibacter rhizosphaerae]